MRISNLTIDELEILGRGEKMDKYQNMLWEQLEDQFGTSPVPTRTPRPAPTPKHSQKLSPRLRSKPRFTSVSTLRPRPTPVLTRISK